MGATARAVDFSGVKERGAFNPRRVASGDYAAKITKVEDAEAKGDGSFQYVFTIKLQKYSQHSYPYYCKLQDNQLWKLRNLMISAGINVPKKRMKLDPNKAVGKLIGVTMEDDEFEGKLKSVVAAVFPIAELADGGVDVPTEDEAGEFDEGTPTLASSEDEAEEEAEETPKKKKKAKKGKKKKGSEEDLEELDISDV